MTPQRHYNLNVDSYHILVSYLRVFLIHTLKTMIVVEILKKYREDKEEN